MIKNKYLFSIVILMLCTIQKMNAQVGLSAQTLSFFEMTFDLPLPLQLSSLNSISSSPPNDLSTYFKNINSPAKMPAAYSFEHLAFFCKIEVELERATKMPVKFRLGDVPTVDRIEGYIE